MLCLEETPYGIPTPVDEFRGAELRRTNVRPLDIHPTDGVMVARFYKRSILEAALANIDLDKMHDVEAYDLAIIYYEAYKISQRVGIFPNAVMLEVPETLRDMWKEYYLYGQATKHVMKFGLYKELLRKRAGLRKVVSFPSHPIASIILLLAEGLPFTLGRLSVKH